jgi:hypothetical protein
MAAHKTRFKGGGHGGVTGMLTARIAPSFGCPAIAAGGGDDASRGLSTDPIDGRPRQGRTGSNS